MSEIALLSNFLKSKGLSIPGDNAWLKSCVSCYKSMTPNYNQTDLNQFVFTQWRLADLRSVGAASLPPNCANKDFLILNGKYAVQFNYGINVAVPFHKQLIKIRKPDSQINLDLEAKAKSPKEFRSLKIEITDGLTTIIGFEDKPLSCIDAILPGEKALLIGPLEIRKGCLMLNEKNISLLGGEVDTLFVPNAAENVLARALNLPENPNPTDSSAEESQTQLADDDDDLFMAAAIMESQNTQKITNQNTQKIQSQNTQKFTSQNTQKITSQSSRNANTQQTLTSYLSPKPKPEVKVEKELIEMLDDDFDFPMEEILPPQPKKALDPLVLKREMEKTFSSDNWNCQSAAQPSSKDRNRLSAVPSSNDNWNRQLAAQPPPPSHENDKIVIEYLGSPLPQLSESDPASQKPKISNQIIEEPFPPKTYPSERTLKGRVVKLTQKLGLKDEEWKLSAIVSVKGMEIDMDFSPQVLDKIIGIKGKELTSKKKEVVRNPEIKSQMNKILIDGQHKIKSLNCLMLIKFNNFIANPIISDVFEDSS